MSSLFTRLSAITSNLSLPIVPEDDIEYFVDANLDAYEHWLFDQGNADGLTGLVQGKVLTPQSTLPTYSSDFLTIPGGEGIGLVTDLMDSGEQTMCMVIKRVTNAHSIHILAGTLNQTGGGTSGSAVWVNLDDGEVRSTLRGAVYANPILTPNPVSVGEWEFIGYSESVSLGRQIVFVGQPIPVSATALIAGKDIAPRAIVMGNGYYDIDLAWVNRPYAEFQLFDRALSIAEMVSTYTASKARLAARGITVE